MKVIKISVRFSARKKLSAEKFEFKTYLKNLSVKNVLKQ